MALTNLAHLPLFSTDSMSMAEISVISTSTTVHPDAELLQLGKELAILSEKEKEAYAIAHTIKDAAEADSILDASDGAINPVIDKIIHTVATTLDGLKVKAQAISWCFCGDRVELGDTTAEVLAADIINDLLTL